MTLRESSFYGLMTITSSAFDRFVTVTSSLFDDLMTVTLLSFDNLMTVTSSSFDDFMTVSSSSFDDFMTVKPRRRARKFKPYFTYMDMKNMRQDIHPMVLHHSGYGNSNTLYMDYSPISIGQRIQTSRLLCVSVETMAIPNYACADSNSDNFKLVRLQLWTKIAHVPVLYLTMQ